MSPKGLLWRVFDPFSVASQLVEHISGSKSIGRNADRGLEAAQRLPGLPTELAVRGAAVKSAVGQKLLQFQPLRPRQFALLARPGLHEGLAAPEAVGEMADRERIGLGRIV